MDVRWLFQKAKGHADEDMIAARKVHAEEMKGNDHADTAPDVGRLLQSESVIDSRNGSGIPLCQGCTISKWPYHEQWSTMTGLEAVPDAAAYGMRDRRALASLAFLAWSF